MKAAVIRLCKWMHPVVELNHTTWARSTKVGLSMLRMLRATSTALTTKEAPKIVTEALDALSACAALIPAHGDSIGLRFGFCGNHLLLSYADRQPIRFILCSY